MILSHMGGNSAGHVRDRDDLSHASHASVGSHYSHSRASPSASASASAPVPSHVHIATLPPIKKKKKIEKKKRLENIRRQRHVTVIQAYWRGRLARKQVAPLLESSSNHSLHNNSNNANESPVDDANPESNSDRIVYADVNRSNRPFVPRILEKPETKEKPNDSDSVNNNNIEKTTNDGSVVVSSTFVNRRQSELHEQELIHLAKKNEDVDDVNYVKQGIIAVIMLFIYFGFGMIFYSNTFKISYFKALYFCVVTVTTIGYGEISPDTDFTKLLTAIMIFAGLATFTIAITFLLDFFAKEKELLEERLIAKKFEEENKIEMDCQAGVEDVEEDEEINGSDEVSDDISPSSLFARFTKRTPKLILSALQNILKAILAIIFTVLIGAIFFMFVVQDMRFVDAVYFCAVTISSVGYGDLLPETDRARLFIIFYGILGTGMTANALTIFSEGITCLINFHRQEDEEEEDELGEEVFALMDSDGDGRVVKAEFMLYKLVRMGLVKPEHLKSCSEQFSRLDFDGNGYLSQEDVDAFHQAVTRKKLKNKDK